MSFFSAVYHFLRTLLKRLLFLHYFHFCWKRDSTMDITYRSLQQKWWNETCLRNWTSFREMLQLSFLIFFSSHFTCKVFSPRKFELNKVTQMEEFRRNYLLFTSRSFFTFLWEVLKTILSDIRNQRKTIHFSNHRMSYFWISVFV